LDSCASALRVVPSCAKRSTIVELAIDDDFLVDPVAAGVLDVRPQRRPRGDLPASHQIRLDERPRAVADDADRLACRVDLRHELHRRLPGAQRVGVGDPTRQHDSVVLARIGVVKRPVDHELRTPVEVVERLHRPAFGSDQFRRSAGVEHRAPGLGQLDFLHALVGDNECDLLAIKLHRALPSSLGTLPRGTQQRRPGIAHARRLRLQPRGTTAVKAGPGPRVPEDRRRSENRMVALVVLIALLAVLGGLGFAAHVLWYVLIVALVLWAIGFLIGGASEGGRRWYGRW
jgi:hypothetical protein